MPKQKKVKMKAKAKKITKVKPVKSGKVSAVKKPVKSKKKVFIEKIAKKILKKKVVAKKPLKKVIKKVSAKPAISKKPAKKIVRQVKKNPAPRAVKTQFPSEALFKAKIKVIGVGGGGGSIVSEIGRTLKQATFVIADTDIRALKKKSGIKYFWFGEDLTHGLGTGVNVELAKQAAESAKEKISGYFQNQDIIIFVASLGGGLGSGATQIFAEAAREFGGITFGIFTMPFRFEGKNKQRIAQNALKTLRQSLNVSLVIPNEKIFKIIDSSTPITNAFSTVNKSLIESLESLIDLIYNPGVINIDFADLRTILKGRGNSAFLNTIEESGKDRVEKICENILKNPLLQNNGFKAEKILFNIAGSENLSMFEVEKISSHIANLNPKAKIIFGISKDASLKNKIKTTILMTDGQINDEDLAKEMPEKEPEKPVIAEAPVVIKGFHPKADKKPQKPEKQPEKPAKELKPKTQIKKKKKPQTDKPAAKKDPEKKQTGASLEKIPSSIPVFEVAVPEYSLDISSLEPKKMAGQAKSDMSPEDMERTLPSVKHGTIRRSGLEIKKAEELQEKKRIAQEKEWEVPAFLRKIKFKN